MEFIISETDEILCSHSGLALAGALLQQTRIQKRANGIRLGERKRPEVSHGEKPAKLPEKAEFRDGPRGKALVLSHRFGVHRASVYAGDVGSSLRRQYTVMGDGVTRFSRRTSMASTPTGTAN